MEKLTLHDSYAFLKTIKRRLEDEKEKYKEFLLLLKDFHTKIITHAEFLANVKVLLAECGQLISDFNVFLPTGYEITLPQPQEPQSKLFEVEAITFINKVKKTFRGDDHNDYKSFLKIMNKCRKENTPIFQVSDEVGVLFCNNLDLWEEFINFLPDSSATNPYGRNSDGSSAMPTLQQIPKNGISSASQRTELTAEILNDNQAVVTLESKQKCKEQYESYMLKLEDARFEADMLLEIAKGTIEHVKKLLHKIKKNAIKPDNPIRIKDHFPVFYFFSLYIYIYMRCIEHRANI